MLVLRKIIFYIFAFVYLILCPMLVARMLGFVINPLTHHLVKTGLVYVSTNPPDAIVYVDGRMSPQKTPTAIRELTPGKHFIRIELDGYKDWERHIPIVGKKATVLANILLIPEEWPIQEISKQHYQNIMAADDDILIATNPLLKDIDIFHTTQGIEENFKEQNTYEKTPLLADGSIYADGKLVRLFNEPPNPFILLEADIKDQHKFLWVNLKENPPVIEEISEDKAVQDASLLHESLGTPPAPNVQEKFLINDNNDLLTRKGAWITLYPQKDFGSPQVYGIAKSRPSTNMYFEEKNGELFYLDDDTGVLSVAQILPYHPILNIPIPDALRNKQ